MMVLSSFPHQIRVRQTEVDVVRMKIARGDYRGAIQVVANEGFPQATVYCELGKDAAMVQMMHGLHVPEDEEPGV